MKYFYIFVKKIKTMNIKHRLTLTMWALPFPFIMIVFGTTTEMIGAGVTLLILQMILWNKLLSEF